MLITGKLYVRPPKPASPKTLARNRFGWQPHPTEAGALVQGWTGLWHTVLPGRLIQVGVVRRPNLPRPLKPGQRQPLPPVAAFFPTDLRLSPAVSLAQYRERWTSEIPIRDRNAVAGFGQEQCRKRERVVGANTLRLVLVAARTLWFVEASARATPLPLQRYRPWVSSEMSPLATRHSVDLARSALHGWSFSHTTVCAWSCRKFSSARKAFAFSGVMMRN